MSRIRHILRRSRCARGLTAVELMMVIAVIAIAGILVIPMFGDTRVESLRGAGKMLIADLEVAQIESISHGADPRCIVFNDDNTGYHIAAQSDPDTPITDPITKAPYAVTFGVGRAATAKGVSIATVAADGDRVIGFEEYGNLDQTTSASVTLTAAGSVMTITIDPITGMASVSEITQP